MVAIWLKLVQSHRRKLAARPDVARRGERGGVAMMIALSFLLLSVPLITGSLDLAQNVSIDARVKTGIAQRQYCALAVEEYMGYLLADNNRWSNWLTANQDPTDPTGNTYTETVNPCGEQITITMSQQPSLPAGSFDETIGDPLSTIPPLSSYSNRNFQTTKTVNTPTATESQTITYTITVTNRDSNDTTLTQIDDTLPEDFTYACGGVSDQLAVAGGLPQNITPNGGGCPSGEDISWSTPPGTTLQSGETATLTFNAVVDPDVDSGPGDNDGSGTYCNEASVSPGGASTRSGRTAKVQVGPVLAQCEDEAVIVTKAVNSVDLVSTDSSTSPFTYTFDIDYAIKFDNIGEDNLTISGIIDLLPTGFAYSSNDQSGDITDVPSQLHTVPQVNRERVTWNFNPDVSLASGTSKSLIYTATATITQGNYWSDVLADFGGGDFPEDIYTWPTALVSVKDIYDVQATDSSGNQIVIALQVWVGDLNGVINTWDLR